MPVAQPLHLCPYIPASAHETWNTS
jgi:hypothetical protein